MLRAAVALCPAASLTFAVRGYDPVNAVIPVIMPLEACSCIPVGRAPVAKLQRYGVTPPIADSEVL